MQLHNTLKYVLALVLLCSPAYGNEQAKRVDTNTTNFDKNLSGTDTTVQASLETLDDLDHGDLEGLADDDHTQYHTDGRADTWLGTKSIADIGTKDHDLLDGLADDDHAQYLLIDGTRAMTGNLDMDDNPVVDVGYIDFNLINGVAQSEGRQVWNDDEGTVNLGLKGGVVNLQIGQEMLFRARNDEGSGIANGQAIRLLGGTGSQPTIELANATDVTKGATGLATEDIANNQFGYVTTGGLVRGDTDQPIDTSSWVAGTSLFLSNTDGLLTNAPPTSTERIVFIGIVIRQHASEGVILVSPINVSFLSELSGVTITSVADNELLAYDSGSGLWINQTPTEAGLDGLYLLRDGSNTMDGTITSGVGDLTLEPQADGNEVIVSGIPMKIISAVANFSLWSPL